VSASDRESLPAKNCRNPAREWMYTLRVDGVTLKKIKLEKYVLCVTFSRLYSVCDIVATSFCGGGSRSNRRELWACNW
jgi:hypothetical protein